MTKVTFIIPRFTMFNRVHEDKSYINWCTW